MFPLLTLCLVSALTLVLNHRAAFDVLLLLLLLHAMGQTQVLWLQLVLCQA
jgi:hypothetical protein